MSRAPTRRAVLSGTAAAVIGSLSGCARAFGGSTTRTPPTYDRLRTASLYVSPTLDLAVPEPLETVDAGANADVLLLPDEPAAEPARVVEWQASDRSVGSLGPDAEATWVGWTRRREFRDAFDVRAASESEPGPDLLVGSRDGTTLTTGPLPGRRGTTTGTSSAPSSGHWDRTSTPADRSRPGVAIASTLREFVVGRREGVGDDALLP